MILVRVDRAESEGLSARDKVTRFTKRFGGGKCVMCVCVVCEFEEIIIS